MTTQRKTHKIDAEGRILGRLATEIAHKLRGKHKPVFAPNIDAGDFVEVSNIKKIRFSGQKLGQKKYFRYSGYPGGLKTESLEILFKKNPAEVLRRAVYQMLPDNKLRKGMIKRLRINQYR